MPHCQPEQLALAALHEPLPADDAAHLGSCAECRAEVAALQRAVDLVAIPELAEPGPPVPPPASVWAGIAAATGVTASPRAESNTPLAAPTTTGATASASADAPAIPRPASRVGEVLPLRRSRRPLILLAAATLTGVVVGAGAVALLQGDDSLEPLTTVALEPLEGEPASGRAEVVVRADGSRALEVDLDAPAVEDAYYEIWLIEPGIVEMVPLGVLRPGTQTFELPTGLDLAAYPIVDVSVEPLDGDPAHSGVSVARGVIES